jgi:ketosteroid isomerase-like protein
MDDAISRYRSTSEAGDIDGIMATLTPDVELVSPISGRMVFRGIDESGSSSRVFTRTSGGCAGPMRSARGRGA